MTPLLSVNAIDVQEVVRHVRRYLPLFIVGGRVVVECLVRDVFSELPVIGRTDELSRRKLLNELVTVCEGLHHVSPKMAFVVRMK